MLSVVPLPPAPSPGTLRQSPFHKDPNHDAFKRLLAKPLARTPTRLLPYCLMPNHWHMAEFPLLPLSCNAGRPSQP